MAHTKSAEKRWRQMLKRRTRNRLVKKDIKTRLKDFAEAEKASTPDKLKEQYNLAAKKLDKAAAKRTIHPNTAARKKSQLARRMNAKLKAATPAS